MQEMLKEVSHSNIQTLSHGTLAYGSKTNPLSINLKVVTCEKGITWSIDLSLSLLNKWDSISMLHALLTCIRSIEA